MEKQRKLSTRNLSLDGVFTAILVILGMVRIPSFIPGAEFQLSAPYAVCLASMVGFRRYLGIGICSSVIQLLLGTHTIWNVIVAMVFRIVAGLIVTKFPIKKLALGIAGPIGTGCARMVLALILQVSPYPLLIAAAPGMIFTAVCASVLEPIMQHVLSGSGLRISQKKKEEKRCE